MQVCPACLGRVPRRPSPSGARPACPSWERRSPTPCSRPRGRSAFSGSGSGQWQSAKLAPAVHGEGQGAQRGAVQHRLHGSRRVHPDGHPASRLDLLDRLVLPRREREGVPGRFPGVLGARRSPRIPSLSGFPGRDRADLSPRALVGDPVGPPRACARPWKPCATPRAATPVVGGAPFSCDLGVYGDPGGMPCLILGPRGDNLHAPDEWVLLEDIYTLTETMALLAARWSA